MKDFRNYKWITGTATLPNKETYDFIVIWFWNTPDCWNTLNLEITSWEHKWKFSSIPISLIDNTISFNI